MKKVFALASLVCLFGVGCGGDPREAHVTNVLSSLNNTSSQLGLIKKKLGLAVTTEVIEGRGRIYRVGASAKPPMLHQINCG